MFITFVVFMESVCANFQSDRIEKCDLGCNQQEFKNYSHLLLLRMKNKVIMNTGFYICQNAWNPL